MRETKQFLVDRWESDFKTIGELVTTCLLHNRGLDTLNLPKTADNLIDLRGYQTPKNYRVEKSNSGRPKKYVSDSLRIKKANLTAIDFSLTDFESCEFFNCEFSNSKFNESRFVACEFWGCLFQDSEFQRTDFGYSSFQRDGILFRKRKTNFLNNKFEKVNFSESQFNNQIICDSSFFDCRLGATIFSCCDLSNLEFRGEVKNLIISKNKKAQNVHFENSDLIDLQMTDTSYDGFITKNEN